MRVVVDWSELQKRVESMRRAIDLRNGVGDRVAQVFREDFRNQFAVGGIPPWKPLSPVTVEQKRRMGYPRLNRMANVPTLALQRGAFGPHNILIRTLALASSYTDETDPDNVTEIGFDYVEAGSSIPYAESHQLGTPDDRPPRRPLVITTEAAQKAAAIIDEAMKET